MSDSPWEWWELKSTQTAHAFVRGAHLPVRAACSQQIRGQDDAAWQPAAEDKWRCGSCKARVKKKKTRPLPGT